MHVSPALCLLLVEAYEQAWRLTSCLIRTTLSVRSSCFVCLGRRPNYVMTSTVLVFPSPTYFTSPLMGFPLELGIGTRGQKMTFLVFIIGTTRSLWWAWSASLYNQGLAPRSRHQRLWWDGYGCTPPHPTRGSGDHHELPQRWSMARLLNAVCHRQK